MHKLGLLLVAALLIGGCASLKTAHEDFKTGATVPYEQGEVTPQERSAQVTSVVSVIPGADILVGPLGIGLTTLFTWMRGRRIRKRRPESLSPITGYLGSKVGLEAIVQNLSNIVSGLSELGPDGSPLKRAWKVGLSVILGLAGAAVAVPGFQEILISNPQVVAFVAGGAALFGGLEKAVSRVLPVKSEPSGGTVTLAGPAAQ